MLFGSMKQNEFIMNKAWGKLFTWVLSTNLQSKQFHEYKQACWLGEGGEGHRLIWASGMLPS